MTADQRRLDLVKQVFEKREHEVAKKLSDFQAELNQAVTQLSQLRDHRNRHNASLRSGINTDPSRLQNRQAFQQRLDDAIAQQEQLIQRAKLEQAQLREQWLAHRRKTKSVENLCDIRLEEANREEQARDQKLQDEVSGQFKRTILD